MNRLTEFLVGLLFGLGLLLSGMTDPGKVIGFLDLFGAWDPSLALVMGGAIAVGIISFCAAPFAYRIIYGPPFTAAAYPFAVLLTAKFVALSSAMMTWGLWAQGRDRERSKSSSTEFRQPRCCALSLGMARRGISA